MAQICDICGKGPRFGRSVSHSLRRTRRRFRPNIQKIRVMVDRTPKNLMVCTRCLKSGKIVRAV